MVPIKESHVCVHTPLPGFCPWRQLPGCVPGRLLGCNEVALALRPAGSMCPWLMGRFGFTPNKGASGFFVFRPPNPTVGTLSAQQPQQSALIIVRQRLNKH